MDFPGLDHVVDGLFEQLKLPCVLNFKNDWTGKVNRRALLIPICMVLYSGSGLTTAVNNVANTLISLSIRRLLRGRAITKAEAPGLIERAARYVGFLVKVIECEEPSQLQFLKHSPSSVGYSYLNLGVWIRSFGTCIGRLPGKERLGVEARAMKYLKGVVESHIHDGNHIIARAFAKRFAPGLVFSGPEIPTDDLASRYSLCVHEIEEFAGLIESSELYTVIHHDRVIPNIMRMDYGYS